MGRFGLQPRSGPRFVTRLFERREGLLVGGIHQRIGVSEVEQPDLDVQAGFDHPHGHALSPVVLQVAAVLRLQCDPEAAQQDPQR
jgi:hypothetical protein